MRPTGGPVPVERGQAEPYGDVSLLIRLNPAGQRPSLTSDHRLLTPPPSEMPVDEHHGRGPGVGNGPPPAGAGGYGGPPVAAPAKGVDAHGLRTIRARKALGPDGARRAGSCPQSSTGWRRRLRGAAASLTAPDWRPFRSPCDGGSARESLRRHVRGRHGRDGPAGPGPRGFGARSGSCPGYGFRAWPGRWSGSCHGERGRCPRAASAARGRVRPGRGRGRIDHQRNARRIPQPGHAYK